MMRGTWQTTGSSGTGPVLAVIAAVVLIGSGAVAAVARDLAWIIAAVAVCGVLAVAGVVALIRVQEPRRKAYAERYAQAGAAVRAELRAAQRPAIAPRQVVPGIAEHIKPGTSRRD